MTSTDSDVIKLPDMALTEELKPVIADERFRQVSKLLTQLKIEKFAEVFMENDVDDEAIKLLTEDSLKEIGLPLGPRVKLLAYIKANNKLEGPQSRAASSQKSKSASGDAGSMLVDVDDDSVTELDESIDDSVEKSAQSEKLASLAAPGSTKASSTSQTPSKQTKTTQASHETPAAKPPPKPEEKPKSSGCCARFGRFIVSTLYYIFIFPFVAIYKGLAWFATRVLLPVLPIVVLTPIGLPLWLFYLSEITADQVRGTFHPLFNAVSLTFLFATPLAILGLQALWYLWLTNPDIFTNSSSQTKQATKAKED